MIFPSYQKYEDEWKDDKINGIGKERWQNGLILVDEI